VDDALYNTWKNVVSDARRLVNGNEGLSLAELAQLGDRQWETPPTGYLDVGRLFLEPKDVIIEIDAIERVDHREDADGALKEILGRYWTDDIAPSGLVRRLDRMKGEMNRGQESIERKLRYLLWVN
jgi:hypothetical protein